MINISLLGATGSIGTQVLDIIREKREEYKLVAFSFGYNIDKALEIIEEFEPKLVSAIEEKDAKLVHEYYPNIEICFGNKGLQQVATFPEYNVKVVNALVGSVGLIPTISALDAGRDVYLANKETLVIGGEIVMKKAKENGLKIIPIDSEHSALAQIMYGKNNDDIKRVIITASGGAFRDKTREELANVTKEDALKHPNWKMGDKITIDCATMMNKGFELIEAHYLFDLPMEKIFPILHRESIIHSFVEYNDGAVFAQMASSDMHLPIKYALEAPSHSYSSMIKPLDVMELSELHFAPVSYERYPMVKLAIEAINKGGIYPTILNAANEACVSLFLHGKIKFLDIEKIVSETLNDKIFAGFTIGELTVPKIMSVDELVKINIKAKYY